MKALSGVAVILTLLFASVTWAEIYKWVDEKGGVHFTQDPSTIPEKYQDGVKVRESIEPSGKGAPSTSKNPQYTYPQRRQPSVPKHITENNRECGPGEYETNAFLMRYAGDRKGSGTIAIRCREILKKCCNYNSREFAELVDKYAKDAKWNVIPGRIPDLLGRYCSNGSYETDKASAIPDQVQEPPVKEKHTNPGAIDTRTGEFYPGVPGGIINPRTGEFMPDVGGGYIDPKTGRFIPKQ